ncbi:MAG TPA: hypothetical protein VFB32_14450 [Rudaea sp.]|nr:hypothetical protein [Rudaea sp.]
MRRLLLASLVLIAGCASVKDLFVFSANGFIDVHRPDGSSMHLVPDDCSPGTQQAFLGFDLYARKSPGWTLRALEDPLTGPAVRFVYTDGEGRHAELLRGGQCTTLDVKAYPSGIAVNAIDAYSGSVALACTTASGLVIAGRVDIVNCDSPAVAAPRFP